MKLDDVPNRRGQPFPSAVKDCQWSDNSAVLSVNAMEKWRYGADVVRHSLSVRRVKHFDTSSHRDRARDEFQNVRGNYEISNTITVAHETIRTYFFRVFDRCKIFRGNFSSIVMLS